MKRRTFLTASAAAIAAGVIGGVAVRKAYRADLTAARNRIASGSRVVNTRAGAIEVAVTEGERPVLMVHGTGGGFDQGLLFGERLTAAGWTIIAPSRFGYLRTPFSIDHSTEAQADAFVALLDTHWASSGCRSSAALPAHCRRCNSRYATPSAARRW